MTHRPFCICSSVISSNSITCSLLGAGSADSEIYTFSSSLPKDIVVLIVAIEFYYNTVYD